MANIHTRECGPPGRTKTQAAASQRGAMQSSEEGKSKPDKTAVPLRSQLAAETSPSTVDQAAVEQAEADYCEAMSFYGRNSAEVLVARRIWKHLEWLRFSDDTTEYARHARSMPKRNG